MKTRLGQREWIDAALRTLGREGVDAVRVERLAAALNVTKGSFYWHFPDRPALLAAVLDAWKARATGDVIRQIEAESGDARARLQALLAIVYTADGRLENQIRAWASTDPLAAAAQEHVDNRRLGFLEALFAELGFAPAEARNRARFAYHAMAGRFAIGATPLSSRDIAAVCAMLLQRGPVTA